MKIGKILLKNNLLLAPLAGYTDIGFRRLAVKYGAALTYTEMVSAKGLFYGNAATKELLLTAVEESPVAVQLFGSDPDIFFRVASNEELKKFDIIDVNMGCPVPKIVKNGEGSALMNDKERAKSIVAALKAGAPDKAVTVKIRAGFDRVNASEVAEALAAGGADAIAVHGRLREQYYGGLSDRKVIAAVKKSVDIPVIGNGDVTSYDDYVRMTEETHCDGVMIGRGAVGNPYIFWECSTDARGQTQRKAGQKTDENGGIDTFFSERIRSDISEHIETLLTYYEPRAVVNMIKKHVAAYAKGFDGAKLIRERAVRAETIEELRETIALFKLKIES
ncbi:MAG: tRNA-dihydrouridine synthase family protein [Clostridiales bacterium]|jgi:nifR3 family TIM-barrel protein|nr:tRNA-dihydrouridine synthase family protein [Clostridiales bacterium]